MDDTIFKKIYVSIESEEQLFWQLQFVFHIEYENKIEYDNGEIEY